MFSIKPSLSIQWCKFWHFVFLLTDAESVMVRSGGEDNDCCATNHRVCQNAARLHGSLSGWSDHAAESRYRVVGGSNNLSACRYSMGGVDSMVGFVGGG